VGESLRRRARARGVLEQVRVEDYPVNVAYHYDRQTR
jgi:hypothetical protein